MKTKKKNKNLNQIRKVIKKTSEVVSPTNRIKNNGGHTEDYLKRQRESWGNKDV